MMPFLDGPEEEDSMEELGHRASAEKKRRLGVEQVRELEKSFELENKLEPERKAKLAQKLGLQPRQVAIWFQNRRARWKTKQLEKDYNLLKSSYDSLVLKHTNLEKEKESLTANLQELKSQLKDEKKGDSIRPIKEETEVEASVVEIEKKSSLILGSKVQVNDESDSSAVLDDNSPQHGTSGEGCLDQMVMTLISPSASSSTTCLELPEMKTFDEYLMDSCNFFAHDQVPCMSWYI